jgi:hypothetical protein
VIVNQLCYAGIFTNITNIVVIMEKLLKDPRKAGEYIASVAKNVTISEAGIDKCTGEVLKRIKEGQLSLDLKLYKEAGVHPSTSEDKNVEWVFMTSALNFSFWNNENNPQYLVTYNVNHLFQSFLKFLSCFFTFFCCFFTFF